MMGGDLLEASFALGIALLIMFLLLEARIRKIEKLIRKSGFKDKINGGGNSK